MLPSEHGVIRLYGFCNRPHHDRLCRLSAFFAPSAALPWQCGDGRHGGQRDHDKNFFIAVPYFLCVIGGHVGQVLRTSASPAPSSFRCSDPRTVRLERGHNVFRVLATELGQEIDRWMAALVPGTPWQPEQIADAFALPAAASPFAAGACAMTATGINGGGAARMIAFFMSWSF